MPRTWFDQLVVSSPTRKPRPALGVALSIGTHAVLAASLVVIPALGRAQLPETEDRSPLPTVHFAPPVAPPTPPPAARAAPPAASRTDRTRPLPAAAPGPAPTVLPLGPVGELDPAADPAPSCLTGCGNGEPAPVGAVVGTPFLGEPSREPVRVGGPKVREPRRVHYVEPRYPELARVTRVQDMVILECVIDEGGRVTDVKILRGNELLTTAAAEAVKQWRYTPTLLDGVPVRVVMTVTVRFTLGGR